MILLVGGCTQTGCLRSVVVKFDTYRDRRADVIPEDIDFEFVYALHTFVATVEGQANATKGDTMVLLDDSNSYWWLVRVVKDGSIGRSNKLRASHSTVCADRLLGYLPAEHIETPTERLARLNKHRNIDVCMGRPTGSSCRLIF